MMRYFLLLALQCNAFLMTKCLMDISQISPSEMEKESLSEEQKQQVKENWDEYHRELEEAYHYREYQTLHQDIRNRIPWYDEQYKQREEQFKKKDYNPPDQAKSTEELENLKNQYPEVIESHLKEKINAIYKPSHQPQEPVEAQPQELSALQNIQKTILSGVQRLLHGFGAKWQAVDRRLERLASIEKNGDFVGAAKEAQRQADKREKEELQVKDPGEKSKKAAEMIKLRRQALEHYRKAIEHDQARPEQLKKDLEKLVNQLVRMEYSASTLLTIKEEAAPAKRKAAKDVVKQIDATLHYMGFHTNEIQKMIGRGQFAEGLL